MTEKEIYIAAKQVIDLFGDGARTNALMRAAKLKDQGDNRLTSYSLRHTYCVRKLKQGVPVYRVARNMGTSVDRIEKNYGLILNATAMKKVSKEVLEI